MNNQARFCKLKCKYNVQGICSTYGECIAKDLFISEFEEIKTELQNPKEIGLDFFDGLDYAERIIDKHIEELEGKCNAIK